MTNIKASLKSLASTLMGESVGSQYNLVTDPDFYVRLITESGVVDVRYYERQTGLSFATAQAVAEHYVRQGFTQNFSPNPLFESRGLFQDVLAKRFTMTAGDVQLPPLGLYLSQIDKLRTVNPHPLWNVKRYLRKNPKAKSHRAGPLGHIWANLKPGATIHLTSTENVTEVSWEDFLEHQTSQLARITTVSPARIGLYFSAEPDPPFHRPEVDWQPTQQPLVSIVLPTWNRASSLRKSIDSVRAQTWQNWELLVADDGSTDDTALLVATLAERDPRIKFLPGEHSGVSATRNRAIRAARGDYIAFLDSDNTWFSDFLINMISAMHHNRYRAGFSTIALEGGGTENTITSNTNAPDSTDIDEEKGEASEPEIVYRRFEGNLDALLYTANYVDMNGLVVRSEIIREIGGFDEELQRAVDYDLVVRIEQVAHIHRIPFTGVSYDDSVESSDRISVTQPRAWNAVVRQKHLVNWSEIRAQAFTPSLISVIMPAIGAYQDVVARIRQLVADAEHEQMDLQIILAGRGTDRAKWLRYSSLIIDGLPVKMFLSSRNASYSALVNACLPLVEGETLVVLDSGIEIHEHLVTNLVAQLSVPGHGAVMPVTLAYDGTIHSAGSLLSPGKHIPTGFLTDLPPEDLPKAAKTVEVPMLSGKSFAIRTHDLVALNGLNILLHNGYELEDLSLRLRTIHPDQKLCLLPDQIVATTTPNPHWGVVERQNLRVFSADQQGTTTLPDAAAFWQANADTAIAHWSGEITDERVKATPHLVRTAQRVASGPFEGKPSLRWAIKIAAPANSAGETWGDTHFARSLASALRELGQEVVIDNSDSAERPTRYLDDVNLVLRGLDRVELDPTKINLMWLISHPDLVSATELTTYNRVFAASTSWARTKREQWGMDIEPLLQCTSPDRFNQDEATATGPGTDHPAFGKILFVGNSRGIPRKSVMAPLKAGIDVSVYGGGWQAFIGNDHVSDTFIPNEQLSTVYRNARVVLNDHWADMGRENFISNRLFDVVASGGRVISDRLTGISDIFGGAVLTYESDQELVELLSSDFEKRFADQAERDRIAEGVRTDHSFRARAMSLITAALSEHEGS